MEKAIGTSERSLGAGEALRRVLECVASGILMEGEILFELCNLHVNLYTELTFMHQLNGICAQMALELKILVKRKLLMPLAI